MMVALAFTTLTMSAQDESKITVYAGLGTSTLTGDDSDHIKGAFAYKIGANYDVAVSESFSIIPGIEFANKPFENKNISGAINRYYLQIPVLAAYKINLNDNMKLSLKAGPYAGYGLFGSDIDYYGGGQSNVFDKNDCDRFDAGVQVGASLDFEKFTVGLEFSRSFTKYNSDFKFYTQGIGVVIGYKL